MLCLVKLTYFYADNLHFENFSFIMNHAVYVYEHFCNRQICANNTRLTLHTSADGLWHHIYLLLCALCLIFCVEMAVYILHFIVIYLSYSVLHDTAHDAVGSGRAAVLNFSVANFYQLVLNLGNSHVELLSNYWSQLNTHLCCCLLSCNQLQYIHCTSYNSCFKFNTLQVYYCIFGFLIKCAFINHNFAVRSITLALLKWHFVKKE